MSPPDWLWIPITLFAALAQTVRNATQRGLSASLGTLGATLVRFLYGIPFALLWLALVMVFTGESVPAPTLKFAGWVTLSALSQIGATALLLRVMAERNFALGVAYAKSEVLQIAVFGFMFLGDPITPAIALAAAVGTVGVLMLSPIDRERPFRALLSGWTSRIAVFGLLSGAGFGFAAVGYRGAALALGDSGFLMAAACTLMAAQPLQTVLLGGWLLVRDAGVIPRVLRAWRGSLVVGMTGAAASAGWFTACAIQTAANVRTLALVELLFTYIISRRVFRERLSRMELAGLIMLGAALVVITAAG